MRTISYTAKERRAANQVWNAAERYNFDPLFLAVETGDLDSDLYMNLIIGLAYKYYGEKAISTLFGYWNGDISQAMLIYGFIMERLFLQVNISCRGRSG